MMMNISGVVKKLFCCGMKRLKNQSEGEVPKEGHVRVYVGKDECEFLLDANYLNHPLFENLLQLSVDEFGYSYQGPLRIACESDLFRYLIDLLKSGNPSAHYMQLQDLISNFSALQASLK